MQELKYYSEEKGYGDKEAVRFEKGAVELCLYRMNCEDLTYPYTALTWLMIDFLKEYYLKNTAGFESESDEFWEEADTSAFAQYELLVNSNGIDKARHYCRNIVSIYKKFAKEGYNLAKPVPVTRNRKDEIVALKGAKRIAALVTYGFDWVPVMEFDRRTLSRVPWRQRKISCVDHASLIFDKMSHIPYVQKLKEQYQVQKQSVTNDNTVSVLRSLCSTFKRTDHVKLLLTKKQPILNLVSSMDLLRPPKISIVITDNVELLEWFYLRKINVHMIICNPELSSNLEPLNFGNRLTVSVNIDQSESIKCAVDHGSAQLWHLGDGGLKSESESEEIEIKTY